jgi:hypothetical protein
MDEKFQIDAISLRLATLRLFQKSPAAQMRAREIASQAARLVFDAVAADRYDLGDEALKLTLASARRSGDQDLLARAMAGQKWMDAAQKAFEDVPKATTRLEANSNDPQANQTVGVYTCLVKGRWKIGLPMLAKATDLKLRFLAKMDLVTSKTPPEMFDLANQYWDLAAEKPDLEKRGLLLRSAYWYSFAVRQLDGGLGKIKAQKRLSEIITACGKEVVEQATATNDIDKIASPGKTATDG